MSTRALGPILMLCGAGSVFAQSPAPIQPAAPSPPSAGQVATQFTQEKLAVWQQRLKLDDWKISISMKRLSELPPKTLGGIRWDKKRKTAVMWILDAADYRLPVAKMLDDMELTIVHELVHLDLAALPRGEASRSTEEQAVNGIAQAMLALERSKSE